MTATEFDRLVTLLSGNKMPRVWSLLITIFGDLAQGPDQWIRGTTLNQITAQIGIKPEATRVALHRLRKDGWITSRRSGRTSGYSLTALGMSISAQASPRIYATASTNQTCRLVIAEPGEVPRSYKATMGASAHWITSHIALTTGPVPAGSFAVLVDQIVLADWMHDQVCDATIAAASADLNERLAHAILDLDDPADLSPVQVAVLRVLIVHGWRRVILRVPDLPNAAFPKAWRGDACRASISRLLAVLQRPDLVSANGAVVPRLSRVG